MKKEKIPGRNLKSITVKLSIHDIRSIIGMINREKEMVDRVNQFSNEEKIHALLYLESLKNKLMYER